MLTLLSLIATTAWSTDLRVVYADSIAADTNGTRTDTIYTPSTDISDAVRLWITIQVLGVSKDSAGANYVATDTSFANDTFFVFFQSSADQQTWTIDAQDTLLAIKKGANDTIVNVSTSIPRDSTGWVGDYGRIRVVHRNTLANQFPLGSGVYRKEIVAWISKVKK